MSYLFNNEVGFVANAVDAFNRLKTSTPFTLFDSQHRYQDNGKWDTSTSGSGSVLHKPDESVVNLSVTTAIGSVIRETKRVFAYQPGKSLLILTTFAFAAKQTNLQQRVGYFGKNNGVYLEQSDNTVSLVLRNSVQNGTADDTTYKVSQASWNGDKFDGTGPSGRTIDLTKANIMWIDVEWLGVGDVRVGFIVDGRPILAHTFHNDNLRSTTYMTTACLPLRMEIAATGTLSTAATAKQICSTVISEGGYQGFAKKFHISTGSTAQTLTTQGTTYPILAIKLNSSRLDSIVLPANVSVGLDDTGNNKKDMVLYSLILNPTLGGTWTWTSHSNGNVDYIFPTIGGSQTISGGTVISSGQISSAGTLNISSIADFNFQLGRTLGNVSDVLVLTLTPVLISGSKTFTDFSWYEVI